MIKEVITYTDYNGVSRTEEFMFNLTKSELMDMSMSGTGSMQDYLKKIINTHDEKKLYEIFKTLIFKSYGVKSEDGRRFIKSPELTKEFTETEAYNKFYMSLATDDEKAFNFIIGIMPEDLAKEMRNPENQARAKAIASGEAFVS